MSRVRLFSPTHCAFLQLVRCHSTVQSIGGYTIELLYPVFSYASNPWYHGSISKLDSESLLIDSESGCYLVRRSAR